MNFMLKKLTLAATTAVLAIGAAGLAHADVPSWCGPKKATLALLDGYGGNSWRQVTTASGKQTASLCPSITAYEYADGNGDTQSQSQTLRALLQKASTHWLCSVTLVQQFSQPSHPFSNLAKLSCHIV